MQLTMILCSRNDAYMGNSRWRLETTLNYTAARVAELGREDQVEILVADWGSDPPLCEVVALEPAAARIVSFLTIPPVTARALQGDSPFPEVLALNAAARRARGEFIGRIDQDTLVGARFLAWFFDLVEGRRPEGTPEEPARALYFANRRSLPYRFAVHCPPLAWVSRFIARFHDRLTIETGRVFYNIDVGIWLVHRDRWNECSGYDERMIYMNDMEIDMATRLMTMYPMINLGVRVDYDFYHLDHYHPGGSRSSSTHRRVNTQVPREPAGIRPNGDGWGLASYAFNIDPVPAARAAAPRTAPRTLLLRGAARMGLDRLVYPLYPRWRRRVGLALAAVRGVPVARWPSVVWRLWRERPSAQGSKVS